jgi:phage tail-like protein
MATNDPNKRAYTAGRFAMDLNKQFAGWISSIEGGHATSDVVVEKLGADMIQHKHLAGVKYEDISVSCGTAMSKAFYEWIQASLDLKHTRNDGAVITADYSQKEVSRLTFFQALITEVGFPALDAASKDAAKMTVKFAPEHTRMSTQPSGAVQAPIGKGEQKKWLPSNFRLKIDGLDNACTRVNKIEALTIKQKVIENPCGELRDSEKIPASIEYPNLVVTFDESHADDVYKWHEDFVINGNNGQDKEKGGTLEYLSANLKDVLFTLTFSGLGIFKVTPDKVEAGSENPRRLKAEMYCEQITFKPGSGAVFA